MKRLLEKEKLLQTSFQKSCWHGLKLEWYDEVTSTMDVAFEKSNSLSLSDTLLIVADEQTKGRGNNGRIWESENNGNLYFSYAFILERLPKNITSFPLVVGVALRDVLEKKYALASDALKLKWPNDILFNNGKKLSGILIETKSIANGYVVVIGIGIDLLKTPCDCAVSLNEVSQVKLEKEELLFYIIDALFKVLEKFLQHGFAYYREAWLLHSAFLGQNIKVNNGREVISGKMLGIAEDGALLLENELGKRKIYSAQVC